MVLGNREKRDLIQGNRRTIGTTFEGNRQTKKYTGEHGTPGKQVFDLRNRGEQANLFLVKYIEAI